MGHMSYKEQGATSSDYVSAYSREKARADDLQRMLNEQIAHTANAIRESETIRAKLDGAYEKIIDDLHKRVGLCSHCGKTDCAGKASGSKLPGAIATAEILSSLQAVFRTLKEQEKV